MITNYFILEDFCSWNKNPFILREFDFNKKSKLIWRIIMKSRQLFCYWIENVRLDRAFFFLDFLSSAFLLWFSCIPSWCLSITNIAERRLSTEKELSSVKGDEVKRFLVVRDIFQKAFSELFAQTCSDLHLSLLSTVVAHVRQTPSRVIENTILWWC